MKKYIAGWILAGIGILLILGTAGSCDLGLIEWDQILKQTAVGLLLLGAGWMCLRGGFEDAER